MATPNVTPGPRVYRGVNMRPRNVHGMYSAVVDCRPLAADTLAGMRELIRASIKGH